VLIVGVLLGKSRQLPVFSPFWRVHHFVKGDHFVELRVITLVAKTIRENEKAAG
jgi:hypothetical protein